MDPGPYPASIEGHRSHEFRSLNGFSEIESSDRSIYQLAESATHEKSYIASHVMAANATTTTHELAILNLRESVNSRLELEEDTKGKPKRKRSMERDSHSAESPVKPSNASSALFRNVPTSGKKHTRPPMSKLFASLELSPEHFLELQAAAKAYMLHDAFPERQETVGVRGKGDSELVKLKLWNCVKDFLEAQGNGEKFFGPGILGDEGGPRTMIWPEDKNKIISAVTPLLRRIITNERQRQYALETRSKTHPAVEKAPKPLHSGDGDSLQGVVDWESMRDPVPAGTVFKDITQCDMSEYGGWRHHECGSQASRLQQLHSDTGLPDPEFNEVLAIVDYHSRVTHAQSLRDLVMCSRPCENAVIERIVDTGLWLSGSWRSPDTTNLCDKSISVRLILHELFAFIRTALGHKEPVTDNSSLPSHFKPLPQTSPAGQRSDGSPGPFQSRKEPAMLLRISLLKQGRRIAPRRDVPADLCPFVHTVMQKGAEYLGPTNAEHPRVLVHLPDGLKRVVDDKAWEEAIQLARSTDWFDGELNVIVEV